MAMTVYLRVLIRIEPYWRMFLRRQYSIAVGDLLVYAVLGLDRSQVLFGLFLIDSAIGQALIVEADGFGITRQLTIGPAQRAQDGWRIRIVVAQKRQGQAQGPVGRFVLFVVHMNRTGHIV